MEIMQLSIIMKASRRRARCENKNRRAEKWPCEIWARGGALLVVPPFASEGETARGLEWY